MALMGQANKDTVMADVNYQWPGSSNASNPGLKRNFHYLGLQANQLLRQLIGGAGGESNPYILTYSFNNATSGGGMGFGLVFNLRNVEDKTQVLTKNTKTSESALRVGYDLKKEIGKRWLFGGGIDLAIDASKSETISNFNSNKSTVTTTGKGWGIGPRLQLIYHVSEKIFLGTEASVLFHSVKTHSKIDNVGTTEETDQKETTFILSPPTALFLLIRF
jgi:hypothetical protein